MTECLYRSETEGPKFAFVMATTKGMSEYDVRTETFPLFKCLSKMNLSKSGMSSVDIHTFTENKRGLTEVYNEFIDNHGNEYDYIAFVHDDLWINDVMFFDKIVSASRTFGIIGCCGGKGWEPLDDRSRPMIWTHAARNCGASGFMVHAAPKEFNGQIAEYDFDGRSIFATNYGNSPSRVLTIDGSFMCFTKSAIGVGVRFDTRFRFHFYDMDMCFTAFVKNVSVGTAPLTLTHESLGYSVMQPEYMESQRKFLDKWFRKS